MRKKSKARIRIKYCPYCGSHEVVSIYDVLDEEEAEWANRYVEVYG